MRRQRHGGGLVRRIQFGGGRRLALRRASNSHRHAYCGLRADTRRAGRDWILWRRSSGWIRQGRVGDSRGAVYRSSRADCPTARIDRSKLCRASICDAMVDGLIRGSRVLRTTGDPGPAASGGWKQPSHCAAVWRGEDFQTILRSAAVALVVGAACPWVQSAGGALLLGHRHSHRPRACGSSLAVLPIHHRREPPHWTIGRKARSSTRSQPRDRRREEMSKGAQVLGSRPWEPSRHRSRVPSPTPMPRAETRGR